MIALTTTSKWMMIRPMTLTATRSTLFLQRFSTIQEEEKMEQYNHQEDYHHHQQVAPLTNPTIYTANQDILSFDQVVTPFSPTVNAVFDE